MADRLLSQAAPTAREPARAWLLNAAAGNPLALLELPGALTEAQLTGRAALPETVALTTRLRVAFAERIDSLPATARDALLIAALEQDDELGVVSRAAAYAGLPEDCLDPAERSGLVSIAGGVIVFRHPLVRAALVQAATVSQRRQAHAALAAALENDVREDRSLWHRALASLAPDEQVATALGASACRAGRRGAHGVAATVLARAAELTGDVARRGTWLVRAAHEAWAAGQADRSRALVAQALPVSRGRARAELLQLRGVIEARTGDVRAATEILLEAAATSDDPSLTLELLTEAAEAAAYAGDYAQAVALGRQAGTVKPATESDRFRVEALSGLAAALAGDHERAASTLTAAIERADRLDDPQLLIWAARSRESAHS